MGSKANFLSELLVVCLLVKYHLAVDRRVSTKDRQVQVQNAVQVECKILPTVLVLLAEAGR